MINCMTCLRNLMYAAPCLSGGSCTNTLGSFICHCGNDATGHRCQYSTVCETSPCAADQLCITTVARDTGYVCTDQDSDGLLVTLANASPGMLDDQVNNLLEVQQVHVCILISVCMYNPIIIMIKVVCFG